MIRKDHAWLHVNDGIIAISVWSPKTMIGEICYAGDYRQKKDSVEVTGTFHRACSEHGGDPDIHPAEIKKVRPGYPVNLPISTKKVRACVYSLILVLLFIAIKKLF
ncbi:MAG TPA: hypothetical protein PLF03_07415 [Candidatus Omnitrophota bacterium]|nr:hypothetical protein [Candidatus Omnitrophota bacterium]